jgi:repressor LexA
MSLGSKIKELRIALELTQEELGKRVGKGGSTVRMWELEKARPDVKTTAKLASIFKVSTDYLLGLDEDPDLLPETITLSGANVEYPVLAEIKAGYDGVAVEVNSGDTITIPREFIKGDPQDYFVIKAKGDSMYPKIADGDFVLVRRQDSVDSGRIAVIIYNSDDATIKRVNYVAGENWLELEPFNRLYAPMRISGSDVSLCKILGQVKKLIRDF